MTSPLENVEFADNPDSRCPVVLILDTSASMNGESIRALNEGLVTLKEDLEQDELARRRVEIAIVSFGSGGVRLVTQFVTAGAFEPPHLVAGGNTPMGEAIQSSLDLITTRKNAYRANGIAYYRPWAFLITDGQPTDTWAASAARIRAEESANGVTFFAVGVGGADMETLRQIAVRPPIALKGLAFRELFQWLSASQKQVSASQVGDQVALPTVTWGAV